MASSEKLSPVDSARELLAIGLRCVDGVNEDSFEELTRHRIPDLLGTRAVNWIQNGLLLHESKQWRLTFRGRLLADRIAGEIVQAKK